MFFNGIVRIRASSFQSNKARTEDGLTKASRLSDLYAGKSNSGVGIVHTAIKEVGTYMTTTKLKAFNILESCRPCCARLVMVAFSR